MYIIQKVMNETKWNFGYFFKELQKYPFKETVYHISLQMIKYIISINSPKQPHT